MRAFLALSALLFALPALAASPPRVWCQLGDRRVLREDPPGDARSLRLNLARNEWGSFQIFVRSETSLPAVTIVPAALVGLQGVIPPESFVLYRQHYIDITRASHKNDQFRTGGYPDPLIPFIHPVTSAPLSGGIYQASPYNVPARRVQGYWIDLYVSTAVRAGTYAGRFDVRSQGVRINQIQVELVVWDFVLPPVPALRTRLGSPADALREYDAKRAAAGQPVPARDWDAVHAQCSRLLADHRVNAVPKSGSVVPVEGLDGSFSVDAAAVAGLRRFIDDHGVNAVEVPVRRAPNPTLRALLNELGDPAKLPAWLTAWEQVRRDLNRPSVDFFLYLYDEPGSEIEYQSVRLWGTTIRQAGSPVKVLVTEQSDAENPAWRDLHGAVDIWCPHFFLFDPASAAARRAQGETFWAYTANTGGSGVPWWPVDFPLVHLRAPAWIAWLHHVQGLLYWGDAAAWNDRPWTDPVTWRDDAIFGDNVYNGDGVLTYPADEAGYGGIVPSIRLKALRDAVEDHAYLALLETAGRRAEAEPVVRTAARSFQDWDRDPDKYHQARRSLADLILGR